MKTIALTFGRFNPPTTGHVHLIQTLLNQKADEHRVHLSNSQDPKKNPLTREQRIRYLSLFVGQRSSSLVSPEVWVNNPLEALVEAARDGFKRVIYVCGGDRADDMTKTLNKYNGAQLRVGTYNFDEIKVVNAGNRSDIGAGKVGLEHMSASVARQAVLDDDYTTFLWCLPNWGVDYAEEIWNDLKAGMNV